MIRIEQEQDIEILRQVALKLHREVNLLVERIKELTRELARLKGEEAAKAQTELDLLKELLARREHALFGDSSEKRRSTAEPAEPTSTSPRQGHGPRRPLPLARKPDRWTSLRALPHAHLYPAYHTATGHAPRLGRSGESPFFSDRFFSYPGFC